MIDFQNKVFKISSKKLKQDELEILDYDGRQFAFEEIKSYNSQEIESVIFKAYFLVSLNIGTKEIKCLSFKDADKYVDFLKILHDLNIQMKK